MILDSKKDITRALSEINILTWKDFLAYVRNLPYGRTSSRTNLLSLIQENRGTCSSKHALVKTVADENNIPKVRLILCIYKMSEKNTASIGKVLSQNHLEYIPEAHCYIQLEEEKIDLTTPGANLEKIENDILEEFEIEPHEIGGFKVAYHKQYLKNWSKRENHFQSLDELWIIREKCIHNLSSL